MKTRIIILSTMSAFLAHAQYLQQGNKLVVPGVLGQGWEVAVSSDGNTLLTSSQDDNNGTGGAWVFTRSSGVWSFQTKLLGTPGVASTFQGSAIALSGDGNTALVGGVGDSENIGATWVFRRAGGVWTQEAKLVASGAPDGVRQGAALALSADGNTALIGTDNIGPASAGGAWVFTRNTGIWAQQQKLNPTGASSTVQFGAAVGLSADGNTAVVGGPGDNDFFGATWVFTRSGSVWTQQGAKLVGSGAVGAGAPNNGVFQGEEVAISGDGATIMVCGEDGVSSAGAMWPFTRVNGQWIQQGSKIVVASGPITALSADGNTAVAGLTSDQDFTGAILIFTRTNGAWQQLGGKLVGTQPDPKASQGSGVAISGDGKTVVEGGPSIDAAFPGATWVFVVPHFNLTAPASVPPGTSFNFTVTAVDPSNGTLASYTGPVRFASSDASATLPANSPLTNGSGSFTAILRAAGAQTLSATDTTFAPITGTANITVSGASNPPPVPGSVSPTSGTAASQTFTFNFTDPRGYQDLGVLNILINNFIDGRRACYLAYNQPANVLYVVDDAGGALLGGVVLAASGSIENSQCKVSWTGSAVTHAGTSLSLTLTFDFKAAFAGNRILYLAARDVAENNSDWQALGVWQIPGAPQTTTTSVIGMNPARASGSGPEAYTFTFSDTKGIADLGVLNILVNSTLDGRHACYLAYVRPINVLYLVNDNGDALLPGQLLNAAGSLSNSQCTVTWGANAAPPGGNQVLNLTISFSGAFSGNRIFYLAARDSADLNNTGWQAMGTRTIP